ncbi:MAG: molecular chaperone DnaK [Deltaproteobacteria bacterium]|nr:molecular chaperone DnaK [Deltaproteobacteria bacterium]
MTTEIAMGIDLGTSYTCVAIIEDGMPTVIPNEWGERTHASVVSFMDDGRVLVGNDAKKQIITNPDNTVYSAKRLIGRFYFSEEVRKARSVVPYNIVEGTNNSVRIQIRDTMYSVPELSAIVLKEMRQVVENHTGQTVTKAVITVPAYFNDNQRQATKDAGKIAGLDVLRIINEPTAAALSYGFGQGYNQRVVLYDLGGGTFDVSILDIGDDVFEVISTAGDTYLGGDDFDDRIMHWLADSFEQQQKVDLRKDKYALQKLKEAAEKAKIGLSEHEVVQIHIPLIYTDENGYSLDFSTTLSRAEFNQMVMDLVQRTFKVCDEALQSARITASEVDCIILVGGPTRLPIIRSSVRHYFQKQPLTDVDPDEVVAMGAAIQAHALLDNQQSTYLLDVTPLTLRLGTVGGYTERIIDKNTPIPIERTRSFTTATDFQERVRIKIYQGESNLLAENTLLGEFEFSGFRVAMRGEVTIEVTFEIDADGIVNVSARDLETGAQASTTLSLSSGLSDAEVDQAISRNEGMVVADRA